MNRPSLSRPLQIASIRVGDRLGCIGLAACPGRKAGHTATGASERDLGIDLDAVKGWGAAAVVTLITQDEASLLGVEPMGKEVARRGMVWFHLPIVDFSTPDATFDRQWASIADQLHGTLATGRNLLVHCRGGLGRSGTIAARLLIERGWTAEAAIAQVRAVRPGAIETPAQEAYVTAFATALSA